MRYADDVGLFFVVVDALVAGLVKSCVLSVVDFEPRKWLVVSLCFFGQIFVDVALEGAFLHHHCLVDVSQQTALLFFDLLRGAVDHLRQIAH